MRLSVAIIALNEAERLPACLEGLAFADEVVLVDSGSTDRTREIARDFGCRVFAQPWLGYAGQKGYAVAQCRNDWVLILDADERVPQGTGEGLLLALGAREEGVCAFSLLRKTYFHGRWMRCCGWWPDRLVRLVDRTRGRFSDHRVHEGWESEGRVVPLDLVLHHHSFRGYGDIIEKMQTYSTLSSQELFEKGRKAGPMAPFTHGLWMFLRSYVLERGCLAGLDGLVISLLNGGGSFFKYAKLREHWDRLGQGPRP